MADDLIRKSDVLEIYADLYDIFDDNKAIQEELHKVFDKINNIPAVEPSNSEIPNNCEYAENPSGDVWECGCFLDTYCEHQIYDRNPDGTINIVECGYEPKDEPTISKMEQVDKLQTCDTCKYGEDKHRYAHICNECGVGINNYEPKDGRK